MPAEIVFSQGQPRFKSCVNTFQWLRLPPDIFCLRTHLDFWHVTSQRGGGRRRRSVSGIWSWEGSSFSHLGSAPARIWDKVYSLQVSNNMQPARRSSQTATDGFHRAKFLLAVCKQNGTLTSRLGVSKLHNYSCVFHMILDLS